MINTYIILIAAALFKLGLRVRELTNPTHHESTNCKKGVVVLHLLQRRFFIVLIVNSRN